MSSTKKNWKYAGKIALGGLAGGCVGLYQTVDKLPL